MKGFTRVLISTVVAASLTACGGGAEDPNDTTTAAVVSTPVNNDTVVPSPLTTGDIIPVYAAVSDDLANTATAQFFRLDSTSNSEVAITLEEQDEIIVELGTEIRSLQLTSDNSGRPIYAADFEINGAGKEANFRLIRFADINAEYSEIQMEDDFALSGPLAGASFQKDSLIDVTWTNPDMEDVSAFTVAARCENGTSANFERQVTVDEMGLISFVPSNILNELGFTSDCVLTVGVEKYGYDPKIDSTFSKGQISGTVRREVEIIVTP